MPKAGEVRSPGLARCPGPPEPLPAHCSAGSRASPPPMGKAGRVCVSGRRTEAGTNRNGTIRACQLSRQSGLTMLPLPSRGHPLVPGHLAAREHGKCTELGRLRLLKVGRSFVFGQMAVIIPIRKTRLREVTSLVQGHPAIEWQGRT